MSSAILQEGRFDDAQESRFQVSNRSNTGNEVLQGGLLANSQESRFQSPIRSDRGRSIRFLMLRNRVFRVRNVEL